MKRRLNQIISLFAIVALLLMTLCTPLISASDDQAVTEAGFTDSFEENDSPFFSDDEGFYGAAESVEELFDTTPDEYVDVSTDDTEIMEEITAEEAVEEAVEETGEDYSEEAEEYVEEFAEEEIDEAETFFEEDLPLSGAEDNKCGENLTWSLTDTTLTIFGTGDMTDFLGEDDRPWNESKDLITTIDMIDGVTSIGDYAFSGFSALTEVSIPNSVIRIGQCAFSGCVSMESIILPDAITTIEYRTFYGCTKLSSMNSSGDDPTPDTPSNPSTPTGKPSSEPSTPQPVTHPEAKPSVSPAAKQANPMTVKAKTVSLKAKNKKQTVKANKAFTVSNAQGKVSYKKSGGSKALSISKAGKITVAKGTKKGNYKIKVAVTAAGNDKYEPKTVNVTVKIKIK